jgi:hypothetical protein
MGETKAIAAIPKSARELYFGDKRSANLQVGIFQN